MVFNSIGFLIYFPIVLILYFVLPKKVRWVALLSASLYFYMYWNWKLIFLILFTIVVSFVGSHIIEKFREKKWLCKLSLIVTLVVCFGILFFYKYFNFLSTSVNGIMGLFGVKQDPLILNLILPVGISFYTFQTLSYVIDVYRGTVKPEGHFGYYMLYVTFFPQLVAGPIERPENLLPQLHADNKFKWENFVNGGKKMIVGFFKKVVVADLLAVYVNNVYNDASNATGFGVLLATVMFAFQIYCDFSGYTDIAIGCSEIMGIKLMQNFNTPYVAKSIKEFWARWHISLSSWFKDYLYIPLGGNRCSVFRRNLNVFIVFMVSGLWHGAAWTYVIWGALHAIYQIIGTLTLKTRNDLLRAIGLKPDGVIVSTVRRLITFLLVDFAWLFFRANTTGDMVKLLRALFSPESWAISLNESLNVLGLDPSAIVLTLLSILTLFLVDRLILHHEEKDGSRFLVRRGAIITLVWIVAFAWTYLMANDLTSTFIYFQF